MDVEPIRRVFALQKGRKLGNKGTQIEDFGHPVKLSRESLVDPSTASLRVWVPAQTEWQRVEVRVSEWEFGSFWTVRGLRQVI